VALGTIRAAASAEISGATKQGMVGDFAPIGGAYMPQYDNEAFSPDDKFFSDFLLEAPGLGGFLGTPKGRIRVYYGDPSHPGLGRQRTIKRATFLNFFRSQMKCTCP
jgi:hypothetical protein